MQELHSCLARSDPAGNGPLHPFPAMPLSRPVHENHRSQTVTLLSIGIVAVVALLAVNTRSCAAPPLSARAQSAVPYESYVAEASQRFSIPTQWIRAVIAVESGGNVVAVSPKSAMGLMQLMPDTWSDLRAQYELGADPFDPRDNILAGTAYLRQMLDRFGTAGFLAAYNAGPKRFEDYLAGRQPLTGETRSYLSQLARRLGDLPINNAASISRAAYDWRFGGLFVGHSMTPSPLKGVAADSGKNEASTVKTFVPAPQSNGLFVSNTSAGAR